MHDHSVRILSGGPPLVATSIRTNGELGKKLGRDEEKREKVNARRHVLQVKK